MSFFNTIRSGFTRTKKKEGRKYQEPNFGNGSSHSVLSQPGLYTNGNGSAASLRRTYSPQKGSTQHQHQQQPQQQQQQQHISQQQQQQRLQFQQSYKQQNQSPVLHQDASIKTQEQLQQQNHIQPQQQQQQQQPLFMCEPFIRTALVKGSYKTIVQLPKYVDYYEWLALNTFEFFNRINKFYGIVSDYDTPDKFPKMTADPSTEYVWVMPNGKTVSLPANQYIEYALTWMSNKINDQSIFPTKSGMAFPPSFLNDIRGICRQVFRIIAHIYWNHFDKIVHLSLEAHWSSYFSHFISFVREFDLIETKELEPLALLIANLEQQGKIITVDHVQQQPPAQGIVY